MHLKIFYLLRVKVEISAIDWTSDRGSQPRFEQSYSVPVDADFYLPENQLYYVKVNTFSFKTQARSIGRS